MAESREIWPVTTDVALAVPESAVRVPGKSPLPSFAPTEIVPAAVFEVNFRFSPVSDFTDRLLVDSS
ncbi:hypothetical protein D3C76_1582550 [compost metagenome]